MEHHREVWEGLIAIEGIDGAGTTTLSRRLSESLTQASHQHQSGCEPTKGPIGTLIRSALSGSFVISPDTLALLFAADRREHIYGARGIKETLDSGELYITDRYFFSSLAYQSIGSDWDWVNSLNEKYPLPEYLIFLGLPVDHALHRISGRNDREIFEYQDIQLKVADNYHRALKLFTNTSMKILELDGTKPPDDLCAATVNFIVQRD